MSKLAIKGSKKPFISKKFKRYNSIGNKEIDAVVRVMKTGVLSKFLGCWHEDFYGGEKVREFEENIKNYFNVKNAITVNSWTSGLTAAIGAIGIEPGDEVIVSPWTMCASATAIIHWNAIPVFADIDKKTFCIDPKSIERVISPYTKAILSVDIFGQSADVEEINKIAKKFNLKVISDTAQAPGSKFKDKFSGTLTDIGGFSLNYHKHIHTGEGGILVTNDNDLAEKMRLIRNHAEAVVGDAGRTDIVNMIGHNYRLGEIESAIGIEQLKKLKGLVNARQYVAEKISNGISDLEGLNVPFIREQCTHVYYIFAMTIDINLTKVSKNKIVEALNAEGVPGLESNYANLSSLPMYQKKIAYGSKGFPWSIANRDISYDLKSVPNATILNSEEYFGMELCLFDFTDEDIDLIIGAFHHVWKNLDQLK